jgi:membrane protease YdiL (CAAX protease family)
MNDERGTIDDGSVHRSSFIAHRLSRADWRLIAVCAILAALSTFIAVRYWKSAFPQASIDFKYDRNSSRELAERVVRLQQIDVAKMKHAVRFDSDEQARIFLERSLGLDDAGRVMRDQVRVWTWHHRWFLPLVEEEVSVDVAPTGEIVAFTHVIPEDRAVADGGAKPPIEFLQRIGAKTSDLQLISTSERKLPRRVQRIYTFESKSIRPAGAGYRHVVTVDGNRVSGYAQRLKVPDAWLREYGELRSKNVAAGRVDSIFHAAIIIAVIVVFIVRLRRGDLHMRFMLAVGITGLVLVGGVALNSIPQQLAYYETNQSWGSLWGDIALRAIVESLGQAMLLIVICGAGEVLYRQRLPKQLAVPRVWSRRALASRRVFLSLILGYALVPMFVAYQTVFYLAARKVGAWSPADVPYDDMLSSAFPWIVVLFAGFSPAFSEEFMSRAFSIPFFQRILRSRIAAIVLSGFIWGFGHSLYPNQPFWIRGVEVGIVGVVCGFLMDRFGLLPLLIWHYTVDAVYTATLLFGSGNTYYIVSAAGASLIFAVPLVAAIVLYVRNRGFVPDDGLSNETIPVSPPPEHPEVERAAAEFPPPMPVTRKRLIVAGAAVLLAALMMTTRPPAVDDVIDYRITKEQAKEIARAHVPAAKAAYVIAAPVEGFRNWNAGSEREEGGAPGGFDSIAATYLVREGMRIEDLVNEFHNRVEAATWTVRFFTPMKKEEIFVEVDPRTARVVGYHKYQDEKNPGAALSQGEALSIARGAFARYDLDQSAFDVKEALTYPQPARRDWLFHFEEKTPIAARAFRRVTVRVAGSEVTQFNKHVYVPEAVVREAQTHTMLNLVLQAMWVIGMVGVMAMVIAGIVLASRGHGLPWRRALRWTAILSIIPLLSILSRYEQMLFGYSTSIAWETFRVRLVTDIVLQLGMQAGAIFLALAGLEAAVPYALSLARTEGRARFGRSAAIAAVTALAIFSIVTAALDWLDRLMPRAASIALAVSDAVATPFPALIDGAQGIFGALAISGAVVLFSLPMQKRPVFTVLLLFFAMVDPGVTAAQAPLMLVRAAVMALLFYVIGRYVLGANPLAWPLMIFLAATLQVALFLTQNHRTDLIANGAALIAFAATAVFWVVSPRSVDA